MAAAALALVPTAKVVPIFPRRDPDPPPAAPAARRPWTHQVVMALASVRCMYCYGSGGRVHSRSGRLNACHCVKRAIFRACWWRYQTIQSAGLLPRNPRLTGTSYSRPDEEFCADLMLLATRTLNQTELRVFRVGICGGATWRTACARLGIGRGDYFHLLYAVEAKLGAACYQTQPHALYPIFEYFGAREITVTPYTRPEAA